MPSKKGNFQSNIAKHHHLSNIAIFWGVVKQVGGYPGIHLKISPGHTPFRFKALKHLCIGVKLQGICLENVGKIHRCFGKT